MKINDKENRIEDIDIIKISDLFLALYKRKKKSDDYKESNELKEE